jgi:hypothetical protein
LRNARCKLCACRLRPWAWHATPGVDTKAASVRPTADVAEMLTHAAGVPPWQAPTSVGSKGPQAGSWLSVFVNGCRWLPMDIDGRQWLADLGCGARDLPPHDRRCTSNRRKEPESTASISADRATNEVDDGSGTNSPDASNTPPWVWAVARAGAVLIPQR